MDIKRISWKIYFKDESKADPESFFKGFSGWIEGSKEVFVDVADYAHVNDGPLTVLVGYACDYRLDATGRRTGLMYFQRQPFEGDNAAQIRNSLAEVLKTAEKISSQEAFGGVEFKTDELTFTINDRLAAPNTPETAEAVQKEIQNALSANGLFTYENSGRPKEPLTLTLKSESGLTPNALIAKLGL